MKTCRKLAMLLLLLIHLVTLQIGDAERNHTNVTSDPRVILEEIIITGSGNNTRVIANAVAKDASKFNDEVLSLLSKREIPKNEYSDTIQDDQNVAQSSVAGFNANEEDDLEIMSRVIAKYEPQRLTSRKTKRKIVDGSKEHDVREIAGSIMELEQAYAEVLKNISRKAPELSVNNADVTLNPYLSQAIKQLKQVSVPEVKIQPKTNNRVEKSNSDVNLFSTSSAENKKKLKRLPKKYLQLNRTVTTPRFLEESQSDEKIIDDKASTSSIKTTNGRINSKNKLNSDPTRKLKNHHEWNQDVPRFTLQVNSSGKITNNAKKNLNVPNNAVQSQFGYNTVPRPFSLLYSPNSLVTNIDVSPNNKKPSSAFEHQQQVARASANIPPFVLPTDLFNPLPTRHYIPIKRANHLNLKKSSATVVSTEANLPTSPIADRTTDYDTLYTAVIGTTSPLVTVNSQQSYDSSDYHAITESPTERTVTKTTYVSSQTSVQQKDHPAVRKNDFLPRIASYDSPNDEKSSLNENPEITLYNKFPSLYSTNVPNVFIAPKAIIRDFKQPAQPSQQQVSSLPHVTLKPLTPTSLKVQPVTSFKPALYYDGRLLLQNGKFDTKEGETNEQFRVEDVDESEKEDDNGDIGNYKAQVNEKDYKFHKTPNKQQEKEDREEEEEERYLQRNRKYQEKDKYLDRYNKDDSREKYKNVRREDNEDEEKVDETEEDVSLQKSKDKNNDGPRYQYNKYEYDKDSEEEQDEKPHYKKYKSKDREFDYKTDIKNRFENNNKYYESLYNNNNDEIREQNKEDRSRSDKKKLRKNEQYEKDQRDREYEESKDESIIEDKPFGQQEERYEEKETNNDDDHEYYRQVSPRRDLLPEKNKREEYSETNPARSREEYHHQRNKKNHRDHSQRDNKNDDKESDHVHGETQEHEQKHDEHHKKKDGGGGGNHEFVEGGGAEHEEEHQGHEGEKGDKGYKVWHEHEKAKKGHHEKEHASKHYDEKDGEEKKHEEEGGYHEDHHHGEEGKKTSEFGEKGEHKKGHSTHGEHSVHKKDEYEKKTEFFDEFHEDGDVEKHGEHHHDHESKKGGHHKKAHHDSADHEEKYGKEGKHEKGGHHHEHKGHKVEEGHDHHYDHNQKHGKKEGHERGKKWSFKKGDNGGDAGGGHKHNR